MDISHKWRDLAACKDSGLDFFDLRAENAEQLENLCIDCQVVNECLDISIHPKLEAYGMWGGMRADTRRRLRKKEQRDALKVRKAVTAKA